jgi:predicted small metal-binding protein
MAMRMLECNVCGEPLAAANDDELLRRLAEHVKAEHPASEFDEDSQRKLIAADAYDATDS